MLVSCWIYLCAHVMVGKLTFAFVVGREGGEGAWTCRVGMETGKGVQPRRYLRADDLRGIWAPVARTASAERHTRARALLQQPVSRVSCPDSQVPTLRFRRSDADSRLSSFSSSFRGPTPCPLPQECTH